MLDCFLQGQYVVTSIGANSGAVVCPNAAAMYNCIIDMLPDEHDPARALLLDPKQWDCSNAAPHFPFHAKAHVSDERGDTCIQVFRVEEFAA